MTEIYKNPQNPEIPIGESGTEQPVNAGPAASAEPQVNPEPAPNPEQQVNFQAEQISKEVNKDARMWAMFCHLSGLAALLPILPVVGGIVAPLIIWQIKKDDHPFVNEQGREAVNFQISMLLYAVIGSVLCLITCVGAPLTPIVLITVSIIDLIFLLIAAVKANDGFHYQYPLCIRFIK
ncbi:MAG: DUF4870 domain-containing protein [Planctomycetota bacterium]|jgi:uncharacterized Tic20 family protein